VQLVTFHGYMFYHCLGISQEPNLGTCSQWRTQEFFSGEGRGDSTNSFEDREQRGRGSGGGSPLVRGSTQFANK
jgi:hypothetical protein